MFTFRMFGLMLSPHQNRQKENPEDRVVEPLHADVVAQNYFVRRVCTLNLR